MKKSNLKVGSTYYDLDIDQNLNVYIGRFILESFEPERDHAHKVYIDHKVVEIHSIGKPKSGMTTSSSGRIDAKKIYQNRPRISAIEKLVGRRKKEIAEKKRLDDFFRCPLTGGKITTTERGHDFLYGFYEHYKVEDHLEIKVDRSWESFYKTLDDEDNNGAFLFSFNGQTFQYQGEGIWKKVVQFKRGFTYEPQTESEWLDLYATQNIWLQEREKKQKERLEKYYKDKIKRIVSGEDENSLGFPVVKRFFASTVASDLVPFQPMAAPMVSMEDLMFPEITAMNPPTIKRIGDFILVSSMNITLDTVNEKGLFFKSHKNNTWFLNIESMSQYEYKPEYQGNWYVFQKI